MKKFILWLLLVCLSGPAFAQLSGGLIFPGPGLAGKSGPASVTFVAATNGTVAGTSITFNAASIGTATGNRCVVVAIGFRATTAATNITSVTIGGNPATLVATGAASGTSVVALASLVVPTGTTANIVVNFNNSIASGTGGIGVYNIITSPGSCPGTGVSATTTTSGATMNVNIPAGGVGIGSATDATTPTFTWTGLVRDYNNTPAQGFSGASKAFASAQTPLAVTAISSSNVSPNMLVAAWGP